MTGDPDYNPGLTSITLRDILVALAVPAFIGRYTHDSNVAERALDLAELVLKERHKRLYPSG